MAEKRAKQSPRIGLDVEGCNLVVESDMDTDAKDEERARRRDRVDVVFVVGRELVGEEATTVESSRETRSTPSVL